MLSSCFHTMGSHATTIFIAMLMPLVLLQSVAEAGKTFNVLSYGAKADAQTDDSPAFLNAWSAVCAAATSSAATMYVPNGQYLLQPTLFSGPCVNGNITVQIDGYLVASSNYSVYGAKGYWLKFDRVNGLLIKGGYIDGKGSALWACKAAGTGKCPSGASSLVFNNVKDVALTSLTSVDSELYHIVIDSSSNVQVDSVKVNASGKSPNTDGIHVEESTGVTITNTVIKTGDDCISVGQGTQNLWIEKVTCGPGHGISIGSLGKSTDEAGVQNVTVKNVAFTGSTNGLRIKSWARSSSGFAKGITFDGATMDAVQNPIIIDQHYCPHDINCPLETSGVQVSDITYNNIKGTSATQVAVNFNCSSSTPCRGIKVANVQLTYNSKPSVSYCAFAYGSASTSVIPAINCLQ